MPIAAAAHPRAQRGGLDYTVAPKQDPGPIGLMPEFRATLAGFPSTTVELGQLLPRPDQLGLVLEGALLQGPGDLLLAFGLALGGCEQDVEALVDVVGPATTKSLGAGATQRDRAPPPRPRWRKSAYRWVPRGERCPRPPPLPRHSERLLHETEEISHPRSSLERLSIIPRNENWENHSFSFRFAEALISPSLSSL